MERFAVNSWRNNIFENLKMMKMEMLLCGSDPELIYISQ